jgi:hypothetical protein
MDAQMVVAYVPVSRQMVDDQILPPWDELVRMAEERDREFRALPAEEQARILAERDAEYEAQRCPTCGHHPDNDC